MDYFNYKEGVLHAESVPVTDIAAQWGTPCYVYSRATLERHWHAFNDAMGDYPHQICYSVKANSNLAVLNVLARLGSGFDIVSVGELERVMAAGGDVSKVIFSGVGKRPDEIKRALEVGIGCFNVESQAELDWINRIAGEMGCQAPISIRVNPDVDAKTHPYISTGLKENKFGIDMSQALQAYELAATMPHVAIVGVDCHIGSQLISLEPFLAALDKLLALVDELEQRGIPIKHLDLGGGLGVRYQDEDPPLPADQARALLTRLRERRVSVFFEPGRAIAANAGILLTEVLLLKENCGKHFAVVDAGMNDLIRPSLYNAWQAIIPSKAHNTADPNCYDVVGPICETGDFLGKERGLAIEAGDLLAVRSAGAYGFVMSSNYNSRVRPAEVMVDGDKAYCIRPRGTLEALFAQESLLP